MNVFKKQKMKGQDIFKVVVPGSFGRRPEYIKEHMPEYAPFYSYGKNPIKDEKVIIIGGEDALLKHQCVVVQSIDNDNVYIMPRNYLEEVDSNEHF